jgi:hypothetical protein
MDEAYIVTAARTAGDRRSDHGRNARAASASGTKLMTTLLGAFAEIILYDSKVLLYRI